jgi:hypothetical protein
MKCPARVDLITNIVLSLKIIHGTNTLGYFTAASMTNTESFIRFGPVQGQKMKKRRNGKKRLAQIYFSVF